MCEGLYFLCTFGFFIEVTLLVWVLGIQMKSSRCCASGQVSIKERLALCYGK